MSSPTSSACLRVSLAVFIGLLAAQTASASLLTIGDPSFEGVSLGAGGFTSGSYAANSWNSNSNAGILRPTASEYPGGAPDGVNVAYSNSGAVIDQVLSATLTANTTYTLSVDVGSRLDGPFNNGYSIELLAGGVLLSQTTNVPAPTNGSFVLATDVYTAGASDPHLGQALEIKLVSANTGQTSFDNVTLNAAAVPEPSSLMLLGLAATGAGLFRRRGKSRETK
ncbi:protein of unknown function DUF1555 [Chthoniobacter flavus Ellin428]|uniref:Ice-binding protein C-terminal domain-containing protein n=1 Tax=Chthoniobacter flavus Ellin428 TaxID=497964 RepID=B4D7G8_9BACT|nr:PEP-CTERM sorting domain-containing protein [Chthoniobacter flavus]EDY17585.1 protein of unknown function DUF1555 [Chthoniobacter flavus Ellin428]TCO92384.1 putative secreted protein with PEP-CTERM sorting signal [Chthoniobacter flavus]